MWRAAVRKETRRGATTKPLDERIGPYQSIGLDGVVRNRRRFRLRDVRIGTEGILESLVEPGRKNQAPALKNGSLELKEAAPQILKRHILLRRGAIEHQPHDSMRVPFRDRRELSERLEPGIDHARPDLRQRRSRLTGVACSS